MQTGARIVEHVGTPDAKNRYHAAFADNPPTREVCNEDRIKNALLGIGLGLLAAMPVSTDGYTAYNAGDYATALREWRPLAEQGNADAQYNLGMMYDEGEGVPQDDAEAVK